MEQSTSTTQKKAIQGKGDSVKVKYLVQVKQTVVNEFEIDADNELQAHEKALEQFCCGKNHDVCTEAVTLSAK
jgi:predicted transcriptional regulator